MPAEKTCCFTGHRPAYFPWNGDPTDKRHAELLKRIDEAINTAIEMGAKKFICGNAQGVDTWAAQIVLAKKSQNPQIILEIAKPFENHNDFDRQCAEVCQKADIVNVVSNEKSIKASFFVRNKYMVDNSDIIIAVYDGSKGGGTKWTFDYAVEKGLETIQVLWRDI